MPIERKSFLLGFFAGLLCFALIFAAWAAKAYLEVRTRVDERIAEEESKSRPILEAPPIPEKPPEPAQRPSLEEWMLQGITSDTSIRLPVDDGKTRVMVRWATWCMPCRAEMPGLESLASKLPAEIDLFLFTTEEASPVRRFIEKNPTRLPIYRALDGVPASIWSTGPPMTHVIDCRGRVAYSHLGAADWDAPVVLPFLRRLHEECVSSLEAM